MRTPKPSRKLSLKIRGDKVEYENVVVAQPKRKLERKYSRARDAVKKMLKNLLIHVTILYFLKQESRNLKF